VVRAALADVTLAPLAWLVAVTFTASYHKIFNPDPRIGFLAAADLFRQRIPLEPERARDLGRLVFNNQLDAVVTAILIVLVLLILVESAREWRRVLSGRKPAGVKEAAFVPTRMVEET